MNEALTFPRTLAVIGSDLCELLEVARDYNAAVGGARVPHHVLEVQVREAQLQLVVNLAAQSQALD